MEFKYTDLTSGRTPDLSSDKLEAFEEALLKQVRSDVDDCEEYLEETIRPKITENWGFYNGTLPKKREGEPSFVDNTCSSTVEHYVASCMDAFSSGESLEVVPDGVTSPVTLKVINQVLNDVLDSDNDRQTLYRAFFKDAMVSSASVMRPIIREENKIEKEFFTEQTQDVIQFRQVQLESDDQYESVEVLITDKKDVQVSQDIPVEPTSLLGQMDVTGISTVMEQTLYTGYFAIVSKVKTIKIEAVPAENFIINKDARGIKDARIVGHKAMTTISTLLEMGIDEDKVMKVWEKCNDDDADSNIASLSRKSGLVLDNDDDSLDNSQREVELYELYIKSSVEETVGTDKEIAVSKLYQVFYCEGVLLAYQETDEVPYCGTSPIPRPHMFWGEGMVDITKSIQSARTGLLRQQFVYNEMASRPRFEYNPEELHNVRDIFNTAPGTGIAVKAPGTINPIQLTAMAGDSAGLLQMLDTMRESGTGMSFVGQGMLGEALAAGSSTQSAAMILSEGQLVQKSVINTLLNGAIIPLVKTLYNMLRENFSTWDLQVDGEKLTINPNEWPELRDVRIKTPLGTTAKLEQSQKYGNLAQVLATAAPGTELAKLASASNIRAAMVKSYELMDIADAQYYMNDDSTIQQKDQLTQQLSQLQQQMQQMAQQLQQLSDQNQVLQSTANNMAQKQLELDERKVVIQEQQAQADMQNMAHEQIRKQDETDGKLQNMADKQALLEKEEALKEEMAQAEIKSGNDIFTSI